MLTVTVAAAAEIRRSAQAGGNAGEPLRVAARRLADGSVDYALGFDGPAAGDQTIPAPGGLTVLVDPASATLLDGATIDFVELDTGHFELIFMNPNDPHYTPPRKNSRPR